MDLKNEINITFDHKSCEYLKEMSKKCCCIIKTRKMFQFQQFKGIWVEHCANCNLLYKKKIKKLTKGSYQKNFGKFKFFLNN